MTRRETRSKELFARAAELMPGGVSSPVRAFRSVGGTPIYFRDASGARFHDEDGNEYVDYCMSWGPMITGHAHPAVVEAVRAAAGEGLSYGACSRREIALAERILPAFSGMEQIRFVSSGTEAVMTAIRLARGATGRAKILKFYGGYHGHSDSLLVKAGSGLVTFGTSSSLGVPQSFAAETLVCPFDDLQALEALFAAAGPQLAAAIVEPLPANNGLLEQRPEWLRKLRELCTRHGTLLILDEVISGFRLRFGGYGASQGIAADLITLGKIIGGGLPVGALLGPRSIMQQLAPVGGVYQAGTLSGNPLAVQAGIAALKALRQPGTYEVLERLAARLEKGMRDAAQKAERPVTVNRVGSMLTGFFNPGPVATVAQVERSDAKAYAATFHKLLARGVYFAPSQYEAAFVSLAHTEADIDKTVATVREALAS